MTQKTSKKRRTKEATGAESRTSGRRGQKTTPNSGTTTHSATATRRSARIKDYQGGSYGSTNEKRVKGVNTTGLAVLPSELLSEILSYLPRIQTPFIRQLDKPLLENESGLERLAFLRVLSQTCQSLRSFALPLCWESIQAISCDAEFRETKRWNKVVATDLIRQLEIVTIRDPSLAQYVKIVTVLMSPWCIDGVVQELARCLVLFPKLHTLQVLGDLKPSYRSRFRVPFSRVTLQGVRTLVLSSIAAYPITASCPGVTRLIPSKDYFWSLPSLGLGPLPCLERLESIPFGPVILKEVIDMFPYLTVVDLRAEGLPGDLDACIRLLPQLKNLQCIRIHCRTFRGCSEDALNEAKKVLQSSSCPVSDHDVHKCIILEFHDRRRIHTEVLERGTPQKPCPYW